MTAEHLYTAGERVRFTAGALGAIDISGEHGLKFAPNITVNAGELGTVLNTMPDGWLAIDPDRAKGTHYVPVHPSMIEPATDE